MYTLRTWLWKLGFILCMSASSYAYAVTIHTWVDAMGVRHFSQFPPAEGEQATDTLVLENSPAVPTQDRLQTIRDVASDLETSRLQREQQRAAKVIVQPEPPAVSEESESETRTILVPFSYGSPYIWPHTPHNRRPHDHEDHNKPEDHEPKAPRARIIGPAREAGPRP